MRKLSFYVILLAGLFASQVGHSQEQLGIRLDNYTGLSQAWLNPAFVASSPNSFDVHLVGVGLFMENNYAFVHHTSLLDMKKKAPNFVSAFDLEGGTVPSGYLVGDVFDTSDKKFAKVNATIAGPSLMLKLGERSTIGLFSNMRTAFSTTGIPSELGYYDYEQLAYGEKITLSPFKAAGAIWNETGVHFGMEFDQGDGAISFGTNIKYNSFLEGGFFGIQGDVGYTKISDDSIMLNYPAIEVALSTGNIDEINFDMSNKDVEVIEPTIHLYGHSLSIDLGVSMQVESSEVEGYKWRAGASLLDFGMANYNEKSEFHSTLPMPDQAVVDFSQFENVKNIEEAKAMASDMIFGDPNSSLKGKSFKMGLPTAISVQGDYQFVQNIFVGGAIVQPIGLSRYNLTRTAVMAVSPRYESRWFSFSMPVVMRDWSTMRMGMAGRLGFISFGTDNLGSVLRKRNFTGTDLYFAVRINSINLPKFLKGNKKGKKGRPALGCYDFN